MPHMPRLIEYSVSVYRLLLAAYPSAFRSEYGEAMAQLFRDTAVEGYRRHGLLGLLAVWVRTLADFTVSVVRQHQEQKPSDGKALSIPYLIQQWLELGGALLSVLVLSWRYALYVVIGRPLRTCAIVSTLILLVWAGSLFHKIGIFQLPMRTTLEIRGGVMEFRHIYAWDEPVSEEHWHTDPKYKRTIAPEKLWEFSFSSDHVIGSGSLNGTIRPNYFWQLRISLLLLPVLLLGTFSSRKPWRGQLMTELLWRQSE